MGSAEEAGEADRLGDAMLLSELRRPLPPNKHILQGTKIP